MVGECKHACGVSFEGSKGGEFIGYMAFESTSYYSNATIIVEGVTNSGG